MSSSEGKTECLFREICDGICDGCNVYQRRNSDTPALNVLKLDMVRDLLRLEQQKVPDEVQ